MRTSLLNKDWGRNAEESKIATSGNDMSTDSYGAVLAFMGSGMISATFKSELKESFAAAKKQDE